MRVAQPGWCLVLAALVVTGGCQRRSAPTTTETPPGKPAGRLVPAVVAGFERGLGGWKVEQSDTTAGAVEKPLVVQGEASRGEQWLAIPVTSSQDGERVVDVRGNVPAGDWMRFGDTVRADVRVVPGGVKASVQPYLVSSDGEETLGPVTEVNSTWKSLVWNAGDALGNVARIGLRWRVSGAWTGRLGMDNVRVGSADALTTAYSVAYGPFVTRELATETMKTLKSAGIDSFPIYEEGWYLNLGTFSTRAAAQKEVQRLKGEGFTTTILVR